MKLKTYEKFLNESIRDQMTPKSLEEMEKAFDNMSEKELAAKELQGIYSIMLSQNLFNNRASYSLMGIDYHLICHEGVYKIYYIDTSRDSMKFGIPPRIEAIVMKKGRDTYYVDLGCKFVGREVFSNDGEIGKQPELEIITTFENNYRDKIEEWHDLTMEDGKIEGNNITEEDTREWFNMLKDIFVSAGNRYIKMIEEGEQIPDLG